MSFVKLVEPFVDFGEAPAVDMFGSSWAKLASSTYMPSEVEDFLKTAAPVPGQRLLLVHGLGSSEFWGPNRNGDAFPEMWKGARNLTEDNADRGYGYKTFEKNAYTFRDHRNHDPKYTIGGKVKLAAWNDKMRRVELVIPVSEKLASDVVDAIDRGMKIAVSMGCRVPHDVCSRCGNKAKHRGEYCKHAMYEMGSVSADGVKTYVDNPQPNFFDISVLGHQGQGRPADASAYSIMKVAGHDVKMFRGISFKKADEKQSDIQKEIPATGEKMPSEPSAKDHSDKKVETKKGPFSRSELEGKGEEVCITAEQLMELIKMLIPFDMSTAGGPGTSEMMQMHRMADTPEKKAQVIPTLTAAGFILAPSQLAKLSVLGVKLEPIDFSKVSAPMFQALRRSMEHGSLWLPYFGDRVYRNQKLATSPKGHAPTPEHSAYIGHVKQALTDLTSMAKLVQVVEANHNIKMAIAHDDLAELQKYAAPGKGGLSAENLVAAMLGPLLAGAYFRSQQYSGQQVGPVRSFVANHPIASGIGTSLLWHKLKGGRIPLIQ